MLSVCGTWGEMPMILIVASPGWLHGCFKHSATNSTWFSQSDDIRERWFCCHSEITQMCWWAGYQLCSSQRFKHRWGWNLSPSPPTLPPSRCNVHKTRVPNTVPKPFQVSDGPSRLLSQLPAQGAMCLDSELVTLKVDTRSWQSGRVARSLHTATAKLFSLCLKDIEEHQSTRQNELVGSSTAITLNPHFLKSSSKYR